MKTYRIKGVYEYEGEVEANSEEEAWQIFYNELNDHYSMPVDEDIECISDDEEEE